MDRRVPNPHTRSRTASARGFTMVEILTVIGILVILAGIVTIAFNVIGGNTATRQTRVALETLKAMTTEYSATVATKGAPFDTGWSAAAADTTGYLITGRVMQRVMSLPSNTKSFDALENKLITNVDWVSGVPYLAGDRISGFEALVNHTSPATNNTSDLAVWRPNNARTGMLKDGWGKEIRFVGSSGLTNAKRDSAGSNITATITAPDGRPFWVSAGPDGNFVTHDDNVYSFEN